MARIFVSHSSKDNVQARALGDWLAATGWPAEDVFLDIDPVGGIAPGERWQRALNEAVNQCEAVIFLISRNWLSSRWCFEELSLAHKLNKPMFGALIDTVDAGDVPERLRDEWQLVDLESGRDGVRLDVTLPGGREGFATFSHSGLNKLRIGLVKAGLDPRHFEWPPRSDPDRAPYRGLAAMEAEDAGIFYGREGATIAALDQMRGLRDGPPPRLLAILGASGAGKSSFMRAGLIPRLKRDDHHFLTLPVLRPRHAAIRGDGGLIASLAQAGADADLGWTLASVAPAVAGGADGVAELLAQLRQAKLASLAAAPGARPPIAVLPIDQAEELFTAEGKAEGEQLLELLADLLRRADPGLIAVATIRTDSYQGMQNAPALAELRQTPFNLPAMARGAYQRVIEGPVDRLEKRLRPLRIEPALVEALLADLERDGAKDALPLLAFTLERLYGQNTPRRSAGVAIGRPVATVLTLEAYESSGRLAGAIEAAVEAAFRAADGDGRVPRDRGARLTLLRRAMIPWLAGIDQETKRPRRRVAGFAQIPAEAQPLVEHLIEQRLLSTDVAAGTGERTVEPAHEALLRQWGLVEGWLREDLDILSRLDGIQRAARDWDANKCEPAWLAHVGSRLEEAEADLIDRPDLAAPLQPTDRDYIAACRQAQDRRAGEERARRADELRAARRIRIAAVAATLLAVLAAGFAGWGELQRREAVDQRREAEDQRYEAERQRREAEKKTEEARLSLDQALRNESRYLAGLADKASADGNMELARALALEALPDDLNAGLPSRPLVNEVVVSLDAIFRADLLKIVLPHNDTVRFATLARDGLRVVTASSDGTARLWDAATGAAIGSPMQHESIVNSAAFSQDGLRVVTASSDGTARLWDAATGTAIGSPILHKGYVNSAAFSKDGLRVVTVSDGRTVRLWDTVTGAAIGSPMRHEDDVNSAAFSQDGLRIVTASRDGTARLWDAATGAAIGSPMQHEDYVNSAAFSQDGLRVVTASSNRTARLWDAATGAAIGSPMQHEDVVSSAAFSQDGLRIVTASYDRTARLWDAATGAPIGSPMQHKGYVNSAAFSQDGLRVVTVSDGGTVRLWDTVTGTPIGSPMQHEGDVNSAAFSRDGLHIVTASRDGTARLWGAAMGAAIGSPMQHEGVVNSAAFSQDGLRIVTASSDRTARLWDAATGAAIGSPMQQKDLVNSAAFSRDDLHIVTASSDGTARLWDAATGIVIGSPMQHEGVVNSAAFSQDGLRVVTASSDGTARLWDAATGAAIGSPMQHESFVNSAAFSQDGLRIVTASYDRTARLWDAATGAAIGSPMQHESFVNSAAFSQDGLRIVTASHDGTARLWDAATGAAIGSPMRHEGAVNSAAFSQDGLRIVTASRDGTARLWDAATGAAIGSPMRHENYVNSAAFSQDGLRVVTASSNRTARLWDAATGAAIGSPMWHEVSVASAVFSRDGLRIVTASYDDAVRLWRVPSIATLLPLARMTQARLLSNIERQSAFLAEALPSALVDLLPSATECDRLASYPYDVEALAPGIHFDLVDADAAVAACESAMAATPGSARLNYLLGRAYSRAEEPAKAAEAFQAAADGGYAMAFHNLALAYADGEGVPAYPVKARTLYAEALARGAYVAGSPLGQMHWDGKGGPTDKAKAVEIWAEAAARGDPHAHERLAWVAELGRDGSVQDLPKALYHYAVAVRLMEKAGDAGSAVAPRYRRASLARIQEPEIVAAIWREAMAFKTKTSP